MGKRIQKLGYTEKASWKTWILCLDLNDLKEIMQPVELGSELHISMPAAESTWDWLIKTCDFWLLVKYEWLWLSWWV